jgi:tellurite resistance protein TehA-like permease
VKEFSEGLFMCVGIGFFYLAAGSAEQGYVGWSLGFFGMGFFFLCMMLALVCERR